jgi:hypothetical protein
MWSGEPILSVDSNFKSILSVESPVASSRWHTGPVQQGGELAEDKEPAIGHQQPRQVGPVHGFENLEKPNKN